MPDATKLPEPSKTNDLHGYLGLLNKVNGFAKDYSSGRLVDGIFCDLLRPVGEALAENILRVVGVTALPVWLVGNATLSQVLIDVAMFNLTGTITPAKGAESKHENVLAEKQRLFDTLVQNNGVELAARGPGGPVPHEEADTANMLGLIHGGSQPWPQTALSFLLSSLLTGTWTIFEALAGDLWTAAVNASPSSLAGLTGTSSRIERQAKSQKVVSRSSAEDRGSALASEKQISLAELQKVSGGTFNLAEHMGDLLRDGYKFTTLSGIRAAYRAAFSEKEKRARPENIDLILADKSLDALSAVRNLIVHKAGVADSAYLDDTKSAPSAPHLKIGQKLNLGAMDVCNLISPVVNHSVALMRAVDKWIENVGKYKKAKDSEDSD